MTKQEMREKIEYAMAGIRERWGCDLSLGDKIPSMRCAIWPSACSACLVYQALEKVLERLDP